jgi:hypothetical protein
VSEVRARHLADDWLDKRAMHRNTTMAIIAVDARWKPERDPKAVVGALCW